MHTLCLWNLVELLNVVLFFGIIRYIAHTKYCNIVVLNNFTFQIFSIAIIQPNGENQLFKTNNLFLIEMLLKTDHWLFLTSCTYVFFI